MALIEIRFRAGNALGKMTSALIIHPEGKPGPFPVFYLLHGLSDDHTAWVRWTGIERYVDPLPLIVVMPNGERGFYTDAQDNASAAFETAITRDLIGFMDGAFKTVASREGRVIGGLSMGGYGAVKLALKHPDLFCAAVSHSGALAAASHPLTGTDPWQAEQRKIFGEHPEGGPEDLGALAQRVPPPRRPALRIDCGTDDFLLDANRAFHARLEALGYAHDYQEFPGGHSWDYWDLHVQEALAFFARQLKLKAAKPA